MHPTAAPPHATRLQPALAPRLRRRVLHVLALLLATLSAGSTWGQSSPPQTPSSWTLPSLGVTLTPPPGAKPIADARPRIHAAWQLGDVRLTVSLQQFDQELGLKAVFTKVVGELTLARGKVVPDGSERFYLLADRPAVDVFYQLDTSIKPVHVEQDAAMPDPKPANAADEQLYLGNTLVMLNPQAVLLVESTGPIEAKPRVRELLAALIQTLRIEAAERLLQRQRTALRFGEIWRLSLTPDAIRNAVPEAQVFRMVRAGQDVGAVVIRHETVLQDSGSGQSGRRVGLMLMDERGPTTLNRRAEYFVSRDAQVERWFLNHTYRSPNQPATTWVETGVRAPQGAGGRFAPLTVIQEGQAPPEMQAYLAQREAWLRQADTMILPKHLQEQMPVHVRDSRAASSLAGEREKKVWESPGPAYLSQADLWTLLPMIPRDATDGLAFYAYDPDQAELTLHHAQPQPQRDGGWLLRLYPDLDRAPRIYRMDRTGRVLEVRYPDGTRWIRTTEAMLRRLLPGR